VGIDQAIIRRRGPVALRHGMNSAADVPAIDHLLNTLPDDALRLSSIKWGRIMCSLPASCLSNVSPLFYHQLTILQICCLKLNSDRIPFKSAPIFVKRSQNAHQIPPTQGPCQGDSPSATPAAK
jgi:hypothetical protein